MASCNSHQPKCSFFLALTLIKVMMYYNVFNLSKLLFTFFKTRQEAIHFWWIMHSVDFFKHTVLWTDLLTNESIVSLHDFQWFCILKWKKKWKTVCLMDFCTSQTLVHSKLSFFLFKIHEQSFCAASPHYAALETDLFQQNHHSVLKPPFKAETPGGFR